MMEIWVRNSAPRDTRDLRQPLCASRASLIDGPAAGKTAAYGLVLFGMVVDTVMCLSIGTIHAISNSLFLLY